MRLYTDILVTFVTFYRCIATINVVRSLFFMSRCHDTALCSVHCYIHCIMFNVLIVLLLHLQ